MSIQTLHIRRVTEVSGELMERIVCVFERAFSGYAFIPVLTGGDASLIPLLARSHVKAVLADGEVHIAETQSGELAGFALWYPPGTDFMASEAQHIAGLDEYFASLSAKHRKWWLEYYTPTFDDYVSTHFHKNFKIDSWALLILATDPAHQRKGVGRRLIEVVEAKAKSTGTQMTLETQSESNVPIYRRLGFDVRGKLVVTSPHGEVTAHFLVKDCAPAAHVPIPIVRLLKEVSEKVIARMTEVAVDAFRDSPISSHLLGGNLSLASALSRSQIRAALIGGKVYVAGLGPEDISCIALYFGPGEDFLDSEEQRQAGFADFKKSLTPECRNWWDNTFLPSFDTALVKTFGKGYHTASWNLMTLATHPSSQGKGLATAIMRTVEARARETGTPLTIETDGEAPLRLYEWLGFIDRGTFVVRGPFGPDRVMHLLAKEM